MNGLPSSSKLAPVVLTKPDLAPDVVFMVGNVAFTTDVPLLGISCGLAVDGRTKTRAIVITEMECQSVLSLFIDCMLNQKQDQRVILKECENQDAIRVALRQL